MKIRVLLGVTGLIIGVLALQLLIAKYQSDESYSLWNEVRALLPTQADYQKLCDGVSVDPQVASGPSQLLDRINDSRGATNRAYVQDLLRNRNPDTMEYLMGLVPYLAPFVVLFVFSLIGFWFCCYCVCCKCCRTSCCRCCRRQYEKKPYTACELCWPVIFYFVVGGGSIAACCYGIAAASDLIESVPMTTCAVSMIFSNIIYGSSDGGIKWTGSSGVITAMGNISTGVGNIGTAITNAFSGEDFNTVQTDMDTQLDTTYADFDTQAERQVNSPVDGSTAIEVPFFMTVGPKTDSNTITGQLKSGFDTVIANILDILAQMKAASENVQGTTASIQSAMNSATTDVQKIQDNFNDFGQSFIDSNDAMDPFLSIVRLAFIITYALTIAFVGMGIVGVILVKVCKMHCCRFLNHLGWCFTSWMMTLSLLLGIILWAIGLVLSDSCLALGNLVTASELANINEIKDSAQYIAACLDTTGAPSMTDTLNLRTQVDDINDVDTQLDSYTATGFTGGVSDADFTELNNLLGTIDGYIAKPNSLIMTNSGISSSLSWDQAVSSLETTIASDCTNGADKFVGNANDCDGTWAKDTTATNPPPSMAGGTTVCVIVGTNNFSTRYSGEGCTNGGTLDTTAGHLLTSYNAVKTKLQTLRNHLDDGNSSNNNDIKEKFNAAATVANNWQTGKWQTFVDSVRGTIDLVSHTDTGILYQLECKWIGQRWEQFDKALCDSTVPNVAIIGMSLLLASFFNIFVVICGGCIAIRLNADSKMNKIQNDTNRSSKGYSKANQSNKKTFD